ncbi:cupin domain-containing protein [Mangrovicella endophytica]|uniref:cupin domain-containing protein n=1 Tax=Mangrovicella endophytica TaxID=2066697 RepID=UPI001FE0999D|nr:cupin domain-containing protein [Mangrovicella endophytica]
MIRLQPTATIPNSPLPLLILPGALPPEARNSADGEALLKRNGWQGTWTYTVYDFWHYHTTGHEVLACIRGEAVIGFGGEGGVAITLKPGDVAILPAGTGHKRLSGTSDFAVVGAYPPGQDGAIVREGSMSVDAARQAIALLALPESDPITGDKPGVLAAWR